MSLNSLSISQSCIEMWSTYFDAGFRPLGRLGRFVVVVLFPLVLVLFLVAHIQGMHDFGLPICHASCMSVNKKMRGSGTCLLFADCCCCCCSLRLVAPYRTRKDSFAPSIFSKTFQKKISWSDEFFSTRSKCQKLEINGKNILFSFLPGGVLNLHSKKVKFPTI